MEEKQESKPSIAEEHYNSLLKDGFSPELIYSQCQQLKPKIDCNLVAGEIVKGVQNLAGKDIEKKFAKDDDRIEPYI